MAEALPGWRTHAEDGSALSFRFLRVLALTAPAWMTDPMVWALSTFYARRRGREPTIASRAYLEVVLGRPPHQSEVDRHARTFAHVMFDRVRLIAHGTRDFRMDTNGIELVERAHRAGRGGVLLGAHYGSFEALRAFDRELPGLDVRYMMFPENATKSTQLLAELNPGLAGRVISLTDGPAAMIRAHEALSDGAFIAFLGDRLPDPGTRARVEVRFFGRPVLVPTSPYLTAMTAGVPLMLCFAPRIGSRHYEISFTSLYDGSPVARPDRAAKVAGLAQAYASTLEERCRRDPYNWFNFFDVWGDGAPLHGTPAG